MVAVSLVWPIWLVLVVPMPVDAVPTSPARLTPPAGAQQSAPCVLVGRVPVLARKPAPAVKDYGPPPAYKVEPPEPATSAVWLGGGAAAIDPSKAAPVRIEQRGFQFRPALAVVQCGTPVVFPNQDQLYHSVFSYSPVKRFDLGRFRRGEEPDAVVFDKPGQVQLFCEVHEHMRANVLVVDTPWFACTDPKGSFRIEGIAPGKHVVSVWLSPKQTVTREIELTAGQMLEVDWSDIASDTAKGSSK
jgi:plastocyanin